MRFRIPPIDQFSFWLGFVLSALLWWIVSLIRPAFKQISENSRTKRKEKKEQGRSLRGIEERYRQSLFKYSQGMHLAAPLFALDEIVQPPRLLAPPPRIEPGTPILTEDIVGAALPYLPAWPELPAIYNAPSLTLADALSGDADIVLIGHPGMGKTVALAHLASRLARGDTEPGLLLNVLPFLIHVADLDVPVNEDNPLNSLIDLIAERAPVRDLPRIPEFVRQVFSEGRALLLLDGTDELTQEGLKNAFEFLKLIKIIYPKTRIITTTSTEYLDGLVSLNFIPFYIAAWGEKERKEFLQKWAGLWTKFVSLEAWAQSDERIDPLLITSWLVDDCAYLTPLELTLKTWSAYAGDLRGSESITDIESHLRRTTPANIPAEALESLALQVNLSGLPIFDPRKAREWVRSYEASEPATIQEAQDNSQEEDTRNKSKEEKLQAPSVGLISSLINSGLLSQHRNNRTRFSHPVFGGYLAGKALSKVKPDMIINQQPWIGKYLAMHYLSNTGDASAIIDALLACLDRPLYNNLLITARWLRDTPQNTSWRGKVMEKLLELIQQESQPLGLRGQVVAAFIQQNNDPSIATLFRKMLESGSLEIQQLSALGSGAIRDTKAVELLARLTGNLSTNVRRAACLALAAIGTQAALDAIADALLHGDDNQRRAAAEALANDIKLGHAMLREGAQMKEDLMVRRATAYGLGRIHESWATELLSKMATDDDQWVVRTAANEVIEDIQQPRHYIPKKLPPPTESPWIIAFAGTKGIGVTPDKPPTDLLLAALKSGSPEERLASLNYLRTLPVEGIFAQLFEAMYSGDPELREAVYQTLVEMSQRGLQIPDPGMFGERSRSRQ